MSYQIWLKDTTYLGWRDPNKTLLLKPNNMFNLFKSKKPRQKPITIKW